MDTILWVLLGGAVVGLLGKFIAPGDRDNIPLWLTVLCGIGGMLIGNWAYAQVFDPETARIDWWRHTWQVVTAAILVMLAAGITGATGPSRR